MNFIFEKETVLEGKYNLFLNQKSLRFNKKWEIIKLTRQKLSKWNVSWPFPASLNFSSFNKMVATCHYEDGDNWQEKRGEKKKNPSK